MENSFLGTEKTGKLMYKFSLPCIISLLVGALYNIVDQLFIANAPYLGSYGNAANTVVFPLTVIALAIAAMIGDGACSFISISLGEGENKKASRAVGNAIMSSLFSSLVLTAVYLIFSNAILTAFGATVNDETYACAKEYFFYISLGIPFYMFSQAMNPVIRADGSPRYAMFTLLAGAICNCVLDPIFIFPCKMGMAGAAIATVAGQILSSVLSVIYLFKLKALKLDKSAFIFDKSVLGRVFSLGGASFLSQISIVISMAAVLNMCRKYALTDPIFSNYSQIPTAVIGIVMKFFQIIISVSIGMSAGCIPIIGYNIGAKKNSRVLEILKKLIIAEAVTGLLATAIFELFPAALINLFGAKNESIYYTSFAVKSIRILLSLTAAACVNKGVFIFLQAAGKALLSNLLSVLREIVFGVALILILPAFFGLDGILFFMPVADALTLIPVVITVIHLKKKFGGEEE